MSGSNVARRVEAHPDRVMRGRALSDNARFTVVRIAVDASEREMATIDKVVWHSRSAGEVAPGLGVDPERGVDGGEVERRLAQSGAGELPKEPSPSVWEVARCLPAVEWLSRYERRWLRGPGSDAPGAAS
jgi:hypothetical protein